MGFNFPTIDENKISYGPGRLFLGAAGATPTTDIGALGENGLTIEFENEVQFVEQGSPAMKVLPYSTKHGLNITVNSMQYDFNTFYAGLGSGLTTVSGGTRRYGFGGDPKINSISLHVQHKMPQPGHTLNIYGWKMAATGGTSIELQNQAHEMPWTWTALRASTKWGGGALADGEELVGFEIIS